MLYSKQFGTLTMTYTGPLSNMIDGKADPICIQLAGKYSINVGEDSENIAIWGKDGVDEDVTVNGNGKDVAVDFMSNGDNDKITVNNFKKTFVERPFMNETFASDNSGQIVESKDFGFLKDALKNIINF